MTRIFSALEHFSFHLLVGMKEGIVKLNKDENKFFSYNQAFCMVNP